MNWHCGMSVGECVYVCMCPANEGSSGAGFDVTTINGGSTSEEREILMKTREEYEALLGSCGLINCKKIIKSHVHELQSAPLC